jgi:5-formaminoimidazole-4-carboxamide-1-beta-D-ribofuranosyl 5'-monophosphate synthetase
MKSIEEKVLVKIKKCGRGKGYFSSQKVTQAIFVICKGN